MEPDNQMYEPFRQALQGILDSTAPGRLPQALIRQLAITRIVLSRHTLNLSIPHTRGPAAAVRGEGENTFVLFDGTEGDPPRQLTVVVREAGETSWEMQVTAAPPVVGVFLMTIGVQNFAGRFRNDGSATIPHIPADVLNDPDAPSVELAILPIAA